MKVKIIGGGPAGLWAAKHLGPKCALYEEHKKIGLPVHCTGLVSKRIDTLLKLPKSLVLNRIRGARMFSQGGQVLELTRGREEAYVIDRAKFDAHLAGLAGEAGAKIMLGKKENAERKGVTIAADGACSATRRSLGIQLETIPSIQYIAKSTFEEPGFVELHFLNREFFAWVVPEDGRTARVGVAGPKCKDTLDTFIQKRLKRRFKIVDRQAGLVVVGGPLKRTVFGNTMLVGDAAGQVKATTGGGIITGMICAEEAAKHTDNPQDYERAWRARVGHELKVARMIRSFLSRLGPQDYDSILGFGEQNADLIRKYGDMDFHSKMVFEILRRPSNWPAIAGLLLKGIF